MNNNYNNSQIELRKKNISHIVEEYYFNKTNARNESLNSLTENALNLFLYSKYSIDDIKILINRDILLDIRIKQYLSNNASRKNINSFNVENSKNGKLLLKILPLLNHEGIDFQLYGHSVFSIKYDNYNKLDNYCLELHINERDILKFYKVCTSLGLSFEDRRMNSYNTLSEKGFKYGDITVSYNNELLIIATCFQKLVDGTIIDKRYYKDFNNNSRCRERIVGSSLASEVFGKEKINFVNQPIPIISLEYLYLISRQNNFENFSYLDGKSNLFDSIKLNRIRELIKTQVYVQNVEVKHLPNVSIINTKAIENDNSLVSQMLVDAQNKSISKNISYNYNLYKENDNSNVNSNGNIRSDVNSDVNSNGNIRSDVITVVDNDSNINNNNNRETLDNNRLEDNNIEKNNNNEDNNSNIINNIKEKFKLDNYSIIIIVLVIVGIILSGLIIYTWFFLNLI